MSSYITPVNATSNNCDVSICYCVDVCCCDTGNSSLLAGLAFVYAGKVTSSSATIWVATGLTTLAAVAIVGLACIGSAAIKFHRGRLRTVVVDTRVALSQWRSATVDRSCCNRLLVDMLPPGIAECLKIGQTVEPESFDVASIYFSDIVGFNDVALNCESPLVIVRLLNHVFRYLSHVKFCQYMY